MIEDFMKGISFKLSPHFNTSEFDCHCKLDTCKYTLVDSELIDGLELLRFKVGPIQVKWIGGGSGYRCSAHNKLIGGKPGSYHLLGKAADIRSLRSTPQELFRVAETIDHFKNGGMAYGRTFLHLDTRGYKARWKY